MPEHALYYPEWYISDPTFMAESLLYWDRVACIVPFQDFMERPWHQDDDMRKILAEAHEYLIFNLVPTEEQKDRAHLRIEAFAQQEPPEWCRPENLKPHHKQIFSAYKYKPETVQLLRDRGWAKQYEHPNNLELQLISDAAADLVLGALVDECCSDKMPPVTDDPGSFTANCNLILQELGSHTGITVREKIDPETPELIENDFSFLLAKIPHLSLRPKNVSAQVLRKILKAREDPELDQQRIAFHKKVDDYLEKFRYIEDPERQLVGEEFSRELNNDLIILNRNLRRVGLDALLSKEGVVAVMLGLLTGLVSPGIGIVFGLGTGIWSYHIKRQETFEKHWSSWVFSTTADRLTVW